MSAHLALDLPPCRVNSSAWKKPSAPHWRAVLLALGEPLPFQFFPEIGAAVATIRPGDRLFLVQAAPRGPALYRAALYSPYRAPRSVGFPRSLPLEEAKEIAAAWILENAGPSDGWVSSTQAAAALKRQRVADVWATQPATAWQRRFLAKRAPGVILDPGATAGEAAALIDAVFVRRQAPRVRAALFRGGRA